VSGLKHGEGFYKTLKSTINGVWQRGELVEERRR
jgi:hypothetical protein